MKTLSKLSLISATKNAVYCNVGDEVVILSMEDEFYYGLNPVGAFIWNLIQEPKTIDEIEKAILNEYDVEEETCNNDLKEIIKELMDKGLVEVKNENTI